MSQLGSCDDEFQLRLGLFALGALRPDEHRAMEAHLTQCGRCQAEHDEFQEVVEVLALLSDEDFPSSKTSSDYEAPR